MVSKIFIKLQRIVATVIFVPIFICIVCLTLISCIFPQDKDINDSQAIAIAKKEFGCEKVLWIDINWESLSAEPWKTIFEKTKGSNYTYYVIGEKDGEEIYIMVPCRPTTDRPFITTWVFDFKFSQIVEKFNECGARYVADVPDDYKENMHEDSIDYDFGDKSILENIAIDHLNAIGVDFETFYEQLDVKGIFHYYWKEENVAYSCMVTQENGELKAYKKSVALS